MFLIPHPLAVGFPLFPLLGERVRVRGYNGYYPL